MAVSMSKDDILFTPGPLTTSRSVKQAMLRDLGSRDSSFLHLTQSIRKSLLRFAGVESDFTSVIIQGSGTYGVESVISSIIPEKGKILILSNGAYGRRMVEIVKILRIPYSVLNYAEDQKPSLVEIEGEFKKDPDLTHLSMVHSETTSGIFNPIQEIGELCHQYEKIYLVDAMSSFGGVPIDFSRCFIDYLISSSNKCLEGVPGFSFVIARRSHLEKTEGNARSLSLDLYSQWKLLEDTGEFRFTPPTQVLLAFEQALIELELEGGILARSQRYRGNHALLVKGMTELGFKTYLKPEDLGFIITSFHYLEDPWFKYREFYERLQKRGFLIYSGRVSNAHCFRIGNIGRIFESDVRNLLSAVRETLKEMEFNL